MNTIQLSKLDNQEYVTNKVELEDKITLVDLVLIIVSAISLAWAFSLI